MTKRKTLANFIKPLYSDAKTGQIVIDEPVGDETPGPAAVELLPELRGGETLYNPRSGKTYRVHKVRKPKRDTGYEENLYRLENVVIGNQEWTGQELSEAGLVLEE